jgi:hypothetical protein
MPSFPPHYFSLSTKDCCGHGHLVSSCLSTCHSTATTVAPLMHFD